MNALEDVGQRLFSAGSKYRVHGKLHGSIPFAGLGRRLKSTFSSELAVSTGPGSGLA
jgi:hypothetical protein